MREQFTFDILDLRDCAVEPFVAVKTDLLTNNIVRLAQHDISRAKAMIIRKLKCGRKNRANIDIVFCAVIGEGILIN